MRTRNSLILAAVVALVLLGGWFLFHARWDNPKPLAAALPSASVVRVDRGSISHRLVLAGQFQPYQTVDIHPKVSGFIRTIYVDIGDRVHRGETLAVLEVPELRAQVQGTISAAARSKDDVTRAQHEVTRAESEYTALHDENERLQATAKAQPGLVAQQELDDALGKDLAAQAQVDAAKSALSAARNGEQVSTADEQRVEALQSYTNVVAPLDGVITWRYADTGALIQSGRDSNDQALPIVKLAQSGLLRLRMPVPEDAVQYVRIGDPVGVRVDAIGRSFVAKVTRFTRNVNFETRTMEMEVDVPNKNLSIDPGMYAVADFQLAHADDVLVLPVEALVLDGDREMVDVIDGENRVRRRLVEVGIKGSRLAEIRSGLVEGDRVVLGGQSNYTEGEEIAPLLSTYSPVENEREMNSVVDSNSDAGSGSGANQ